jgi:hypothetical protein
MQGPELEFHQGWVAAIAGERRAERDDNPPRERAEMAKRRGATTGWPFPARDG